MKELIKEAQLKYEAGTPIMSDEAYDLIVDHYGEIENIGPGGDIPHKYRMYSLKKYYEGDSYEGFSNTAVVTTPKLDGAAVSLYYVQGRLVSALTRGDGIKGKDIYAKMKYLVPEILVSCSEKELFITGEVVAKKKLKNSRNFAAGALNLKDLNEFQNRIEEGDLKFIAYGLRPYTETYLKDMGKLTKLGFLNVWENEHELVDKYPTDGVVFRVSCNTLYQEMGFTSKFPRGAYALKKRHNGYVTKLIDVEWNTGRTGVVAPTGIIEPVETEDGAVLSRVTLNNIAFINEMNLEIGCLVRVERAGDIIPRVIERVA